jgi:hypothetical protein
MARVSTTRVPLAPIGWPSATAPPFTFTMASSSPSSWVERRATAAKASLISTRSRSAGATPARRQASAMARDGWEWRLVSGPATVP